MNEETAQFIADRLARWRIALGLTQHDIARVCQLSHGTVSHIEAGLSTPRVNTLIRVVEDGLGMSLDDFLSKEPPRMRTKRAAGIPVPNLRAWRVYRSISAAMLADVCGVSRATISHVETGGYASRRLAMRICRALSITLDQLDASPLAPITSARLYAVFDPTMAERQEAYRNMTEASAAARSRVADEELEDVLARERESLREDIDFTVPESVPEKYRASLDFLRAAARMAHATE